MLLWYHCFILYYIMVGTFLVGHASMVSLFYTVLYYGWHLFGWPCFYGITVLYCIILWLAPFWLAMLLWYHCFILYYIMVGTFLVGHASMVSLFYIVLYYGWHLFGWPCFYGITVLYCIILWLAPFWLPMLLWYHCFILYYIMVGIFLVGHASMVSLFYTVLYYG